MPPSSSRASRHRQLRSSKPNNRNNNGLIGGGSNNNVNSGNNNQINHFNVTQVALEEGEDVELDRLLDRYVSKDALHNYFYSPPECHPDTRTTVRNEIGGWIDESGLEKSPLLWLNGPAAVGKSVIAKTISGFHDQIVATFFFATSSDKSAATLFPTLAWQLARKIPDTRKHIIASLKSSGSLQTTQIEEQFDLLILQPLQSTTMLSYRPVMVIDGIDECIDESMLVRFLRALVRAGESGSMPVRFIICSRQEPRIRAILGRAHDFIPTANKRELVLLSAMYSTLDLLIPISRVYRSRPEHYPQTPMQWIRAFKIFLQEVRELYRPIHISRYKEAPSDDCDELVDTLDRIYPHSVISTIQIGFSEECKHDIARYITDTFKAIPQPEDGTGTWFQPSDISNLVKASCGQFLYATTIIRLLEDPDLDLEPKDVFEMARRGSLPNPDLDKLYKAVLERAQNTIRRQAQKVGSDYQTEWGFVMDSLAIVVFFCGNVRFFTAPKSFLVIESLLGLEWGNLSKKLATMRSILKIAPRESVEVHHRSFLEFLQSRERSGEYFISYSAALRRILILMGRAGLRYNTFKNNDTRRLYVQEMIDACHHKFFERCRFPAVLDRFHRTIHFTVFLPVLLFPTPLALFGSRACQLIMLIFLDFAGTFILSLTTYTFFLNRSMIVPFFHPFLHPSSLFTGGFLVPSRLLFKVVNYILFIFVLPSLLQKGLALRILSAFAMMFI